MACDKEFTNCCSFQQILSDVSMNLNAVTVSTFIKNEYASYIDLLGIYLNYQTNKATLKITTLELCSLYLHTRPKDST
jgi:hypothetical protein